MKRICLIVLSFFALLMSGCSNKSELYLTTAEPFTAEQLRDSDLQDIESDSNLENVQVYKKNGNTTAMFLYAAPIEHSHNHIIKDGNGYLAEGSYFNKSFPVELSEVFPIEVSSNSNYARIYLPNRKAHGKSIKRENIFGLNKDAVVYEKAFENGEDYICYPTSFGVNTEIVIRKRTSANKYQIKIQLPNLAPDTSSPDYVLFKTALEKGDVKSLLYTPLAVDGNGNWSYANSVKLIGKDSENNIFTVEYIVDDAFLNDKNTKFPVTLNQSIHLYKSKQPDTSAYENTGDVASHYLSPYILLGDKTLKGEGWTYIRFETLNSLDIDPEKIVSAKYVFHNLFDLKKETKISAYAVTADWCSINTRWFNRPPFDEKPISEVIVKTSGDYELDVTALLVEIMKNKGKENATYSIQNSFMIRSDTENSNVIISSGDNGLFSPVLKIALSE